MRDPISVSITIGIDGEKLDETEWFLYEEDSVRESFLRHLERDLKSACNDSQNNLSSFISNFLATNKYTKPYIKILYVRVK